MALFQELNGSGMTVILVTHEPDIARYASRIITFRDGIVRSDLPVSGHTDAKEALSKELLEPSESGGGNLP
jgi:putative ABC transport system ATP-binding protein